MCPAELRMACHRCMAPVGGPLDRTSNNIVVSATLVRPARCLSKTKLLHLKPSAGPPTNGPVGRWCGLGMCRRGQSRAEDPQKGVMHLAGRLCVCDWRRPVADIREVLNDAVHRGMDCLLSQCKRGLLNATFFYFVDAEHFECANAFWEGSRD